MVARLKPQDRNPLRSPGTQILEKESGVIIGTSEHCIWYMPQLTVFPVGNLQMFYFTLASACVVPVGVNSSLYAIPKLVLVTNYVYSKVHPNQFSLIEPKTSIFIHPS